MFHGSAIGGARPKALIEDGNDKFTAKFSATNETYAVMKAECRHASGGNGRTERCAAASGEGERQGCPSPRRFDRERGQKGWTRRSMVWTLTMLGLGEMQARYASYVDLAEIVRARFTVIRQVRTTVGRL